MLRVAAAAAEFSAAISQPDKPSQGVAESSRMTPGVEGRVGLIETR